MFVKHELTEWWSYHVVRWPLKTLDFGLKLPVCVRYLGMAEDWWVSFDSWLSDDLLSVAALRSPSQTEDGYQFNVPVIKVNGWVCRVVFESPEDSTERSLASSETEQSAERIQLPSTNLGKVKTSALRRYIYCVRSAFTHLALWRKLYDCSSRHKFRASKCFTKRALFTFSSISNRLAAIWK